MSSIFTLSFLAFALPLSNEEDVTAVTDSSGNTLRIRRDTNRMPVRVVAPDNQVFVCFLFFNSFYNSETFRLSFNVNWSVFPKLIVGQNDSDTAEGCPPSLMSCVYLSVVHVCAYVSVGNLVDYWN